MPKPVSKRLTDPDTSKPQRALVRVALAGNPNSGKTTLFNGLTGARQKVANYPGVTVDIKKGYFDRREVLYEIIDLPGTYSLTSFSPEEVITRNELFSGHPDVTVVVVDSANLERNLYLLVQIMELGANPVLCLNMCDEAHRAGQRMNVRQMEKLLGFPVVETVAHKEEGIDRLKICITRAASRSKTPTPRLVLGERLDRILERLEDLVDPADFTSEPPPFRWLLIKLLENDEQITRWVQRHLNASERLLSAVNREQDRIQTETEMDPVMFVAHRRYGFISGLVREVRISMPRLDARILSDRIDELVCHPLVGFPLFLALIYAVFWTTFAVGEYPMGWIESAFDTLGRFIAYRWPEDALVWMRSLLLDGVIAGVGGVIVFLPNILLLFFGLAILEDTGYMARAAFLMDNILHRVGLHGKSFIPMITGFGCSIPGIMATRTLENRRDRLTTMLVLPLMSCGARLPIYMLLIPAFFPEKYRSFMLWLIYFIGIALAAGLAKLLRSTLLAGQDAPFVMELPPYRLPTLKAVALKMWDRSWIYLRKAGTLILGVSVILWFLSSFPEKKHYDVDRPENSISATLAAEEIEQVRAAEALRYSVAGRIGALMEPVLKPMGFDWRIGTALIGTFAAKEVFVSQMGIVFSLGETDEESKPLRQKLRRSYSPLTAFSLLLFLLIATPCIATVAVTRMESGRWRWALIQFGGLTVLAYILSSAVYQIGSLLGIGVQAGL